MSIFNIPVRIYYEDTDSGGIVYYANYLKYMERARTEYLRELGFEQDLLMQQQRRLFVVRHADIDFRRAARFNQLLSISAEVVEQKRASMIFEHQVMTGVDTIYCTGIVKIACLNADTMRPAAMPKELELALSKS